MFFNPQIFFTAISLQIGKKSTKFEDKQMNLKFFIKFC